MALTTIPPVQLKAGSEKDSPAHTLSASITAIKIQLTDSTGSTTPAAGSNWRTTVGNITQWGVQLSTDGGLTWSWFVSQSSLPFGALDRSGGMPALTLSSDQIVSNAGAQVRLAALVDTNITLGAIITTTP